jgi:hypothetical protein
MGVTMLKPGFKGRLLRSLFLLLLLGAIAAGLGVVAPVTATPSARATDIPTVTSIPTPHMATIVITPATTDSTINPGSAVTTGPIGYFGGHPVTLSMVIASIVIDRT